MGSPRPLAISRERGTSLMSGVRQRVGRKASDFLGVGCVSKRQP